VKSPCSYYRKCSGCTKLQFPYVKQLRDKTALARERLGRYAEGRPVADVIVPVVASPREVGYRTSTKLALNADPFGRVSIGLYEYQSKKVVDIPGCPVQHEAVNRLIDRIFGSRAAPPPAPFCNHAKRGFEAGCLKFVTVRAAPETGEAGVIISHTGVPLDALRAWAASLRLDGVAIFASELTRADEDRVMSHKTEHLAGPQTFRYKVGSVELALTPEVFFQANSSLGDAFVAEVTRFAKPGGTLLDLYGGFGAYALNAARSFERAILVDANLPAIDAARKAARAAGLTQVESMHATTEEYLSTRLKKDQARAITHVIVNPPRGGLSEQVRAKLSLATFPLLEELVYVSCDAQTLGRDLATLTKRGGLRVERITPFDMFPQTDHLELVVRLVPGAPVLREPKADGPAKRPGARPGKKPGGRPTKSPGKRPAKGSKARAGKGPAEAPRRPRNPKR
jgi:23S rRNA (uracil-5-)-methyltransferase RumA